jgi:hypothetical protein
MAFTLIELIPDHSLSRVWSVSGVTPRINKGTRPSCSLRANKIALRLILTSALASITTANVLLLLIGPAISGVLLAVAVAIFKFSP